MNWKKVLIQNSEKPFIVLCQNASILPDAKVYVSITTHSSADENNKFLLTGPNQMRFSLPVGANLFYAEEDGGIFVHAEAPVEKNENYNIPTQHVDKEAHSEQIEVPEGAYFTIQNKSKEPFSFGVGTQGVFLLTEYQMLSFTFTKKTTIRFAGNGQTISYMISQAATVTQISKELQDKLDELVAESKLLLKTAVSKAELEALERKIYGGKWSPAHSSNKITTGTRTTFDSGIFGPNTAVSDTWIEDKGAVVDVIQQLQIQVRGSQTEHATMRFSVQVEATSDNQQKPITSFYCDNHWVQQWIESIECYIDQAKSRIKFITCFSVTKVQAITGVTCIRVDNVVPIYVDGDMALNKTTTYTVRKMNDDVFFTPQSIWSIFLETWDYPTKTDIVVIKDWKREDTTDSNVTKVNYSGGDVATPTQIQYTKPKDESQSAQLVIRIPNTKGVSRVIGCNLRPKQGQEVPGLYFDLVTLCDKHEKSSDGTYTVFTCPIHKHRVKGYQLFDTMFVAQSLKTKIDNLHYQLELVVTKG